MHFSTSSVVFGALALVSSVAASPVERQTEIPAYFYLKTKLANGATDTTKDGLYVEACHTGAGTSDATLNSTTDTAAKGFLNGTVVQFDLYGESEFAPPLILYSDSNYAAWDPVVINSGDGTGEFAISTDNILYWNDSEFAGWLACDWNHGVPQLFYAVDWATSEYRPASCSSVDLCVEYLLS